MTIADGTHNWLSFRTAVRDAVEASLGTTLAATTNVDWGDGGRGFSQRRLLLTIVSATDEWIYEEPNVPGQRLSSQKDVAVQVMAESVHDSADADAQDLLEQVRLGLRRTSVRAALNAAGVSTPKDPSPTSRFSYLHQGRMVSAHAFDVVFRGVFATFDLNEDAGPIEHVEVEGAGVGDDQAPPLELPIDFVVDDPTIDP